MDQKRFEDMLDVVSKRTGIVDRTLLLQIPLAVLRRYTKQSRKILESGKRKSRRIIHF